MKNLTKIDIDIEVYRLIQSNILDFNETPNDVLRRILNITKDKKETEPTTTKLSGEFYVTGGILLPIGLKLRKFYKNKQLSAEVTNRGILFNGELHKSPSAAGISATSTSVNGWIFWDFYNEENNNWETLDNFRKK